MSSPSRKTMQRKPSHFGSYSHPSPSGISGDALASIGAIGGWRGSATHASLARRGNRCTHRGVERPSERKQSSAIEGKEEHIVNTTVNRWLAVVVGGAVVGTLAVSVVALADGGPSPATGSGAAAGRTQQQQDPPPDVTKLRSITVQGHGS